MEGEWWKDDRLTADSARVGRNVPVDGRGWSSLYRACLERGAVVDASTNYTFTFSLKQNHDVLIENGEHAGALECWLRTAGTDHSYAVASVDFEQHSHATYVLCDRTLPSIVHVIHLNSWGNVTDWATPEGETARAFDRAMQSVCRRLSGEISYVYRACYEYWRTPFRFGLLYPGCGFCTVSPHILLHLLVDRRVPLERVSEVAVGLSRHDVDQHLRYVVWTNAVLNLLIEAFEPGETEADWIYSSHRRAMDTLYFLILVYFLDRTTSLA